MRRVLVTGSRSWKDRKTVWDALWAELEYAHYTLGTELLVVHGGCPTGADDIADRWAYGMNAMGWPVKVERHPADWETHGKAAGPMRNQLMVDLGAEVCHAFPLGESRGTRHCMGRAMAAAIPVINHEK